MLKPEQFSWIREKIEKTGKVAPVDADKLMERLVGVLNSILRDRLLDDSGLRELLEQEKEKERLALKDRHDRELAEEKEKLKRSYDSKTYELESRVSKRIQEAEYAESVLDAFKIILKFIGSAYKEHQDWD